jgi:phenylacetate-coenzyme A ligase PaaK-like adenylate-forming protein
MHKKSSMDSWAARQMGIPLSALTRVQIEQYQLKRINKTLVWAIAHSPFYRQHLSDFSGRELRSLDDLRFLPFTTPDMLKEQAGRLLCVSQSDISRIVTLESSGTTGKAKRIFFTRTEQEDIEDYFEAGLRLFLTAGDHVLILVPGERPGSVGDLLAACLSRLGMIPFGSGRNSDRQTTLEQLANQGISGLIGAPVQVLALARLSRIAGLTVTVKSVLLTGDYVPEAIVREIKAIWGCEVFEHYGMTEIGLGGAVQCKVHEGYHLREADLYFEVVDTTTGQPVSPGEDGELVVTTLTRQGMPLIRYRTGDLSRFLVEPCPCGTPLRKIDKIKYRVGERISLEEGTGFSIADLDEVLFPLSDLLDYTAVWEWRKGRPNLHIHLYVTGTGNCKEFQSKAYRALGKHATVGRYLDNKSMDIIIYSSLYQTMQPFPTSKRRIELREER